MNLYPKWLLALAGVNLLSVLISVFFLFGGVQPFGYVESAVLRLLVYVVVQLFWLLPVAAFFGALRAYDKQKTWLSVIVSLCGIAVLAAGVAVLFMS